MALAVLLRNCRHDSEPTNSTSHIRYALKCDSFSIQIAKTPIQVPIPQQAPEIIDIGFFRPSLSIGGIVDTIGGDSTYEPGGDQKNLTHLEKLQITRPDYAGNLPDPNPYYYIPTKNLLEEAVYEWITTADEALELEIGDATFPVYDRTVDGDDAGGTETDNDETGGGVYVVAIQQARFQVDPAQEDRWQFQMQFVCESRRDVKF